MATHSSILAWEIPWTKEPGRASVLKEWDKQEWLNKNVACRSYFNLERSWHSAISSINPGHRVDEMTSCSGDTMKSIHLQNKEFFFSCVQALEVAVGLCSQKGWEEGPS